MQLATLLQPEDISVLLIEDSPGDATAITKALVYGESLYNFRISRKESLAGAIEFLRHEKIDVVLLDLNLPDAKETSALQQIHLEFPQLPIVVVSGYSDMNVISQALHKGAQEFLLKGECSGAAIRHSIYQAIVRKQVERSYESGDKL